MSNIDLTTNEFPFNDFQKKIDEFFTSFVHQIPADLNKYIKTKILETKTIFTKSSFQLELVVDTNIIFSEVRSLMTSGSSFFTKISQNPFLKVYAPSTLREELIEKIKVKFPKDKKTKDLDINECILKANLILSKIEIRDDIKPTSWDKAKNILEKRDVKDISFLALNFSLRTHGIVTRDKDISDQKEVKTWTLSNAGQVITEVNKGSFSFLILNESLPPIFEIVHSIATTVWATFIGIVEGFIVLFSSVLTKSIQSISNLPPELAVILGIALIVILLADEARKKIGEFLKIVWEEIKKLLAIIKDILKAIWEAMKELFEALKPFFNATLDIFTYLLMQSSQAMTRLEKLEKSRPE